MTGARVRTLRLLAMVLAGAVLLAACSVRLPGRESLETAIPTALIASDLGVLDAEASIGTSGFAVNVWVGVTFDGKSISSGDLSDVIEIVMENIDLSNVQDLTIVGFDGTTDDEFDRIDLGALGAEMGFPATTRALTDFIADWDDVVEFVRE